MGSSAIVVRNKFADYEHFPGLWIITENDFQSKKARNTIKFEHV